MMWFPWSLLSEDQGRAFQETRLILEVTGLTSHIPYTNVPRNFADQWTKPKFGVE
jgi:hypothetical protein